MAKGRKKFYAVRKGHQPGVYDSWEECSAQVLGFPSADHKSFSTRSEALAYLKTAEAALEQSRPGNPLEGNPSLQEVRLTGGYEVKGDQATSLDNRKHTIEDLTSQTSKKRAILTNGAAQAANVENLANSELGCSTEKRKGAGTLPTFAREEVKPEFQVGQILAARVVPPPVLQDFSHPDASTASANDLDRSRTDSEVGAVSRPHIGERGGHRSATHADNSHNLAGSEVVLINAGALNQKSSSDGKDPVYSLEFDGASKGNPGPAGAGAVLRKPDGTIEEEIIEFVGPKATNNAAEYRGLIIGLKAARARGIRRLHARGDSKLVVCQMLGQWKVNNVDMISLHKEAREVAAAFDEFKIVHVLREFNSVADGLANVAVFRGQNAVGSR